MKKTSKRLLAMLLALIMAFSVSSIFMVSASAADTTKLSAVLNGITNKCTVTIKPLNGSTIDIQGFKIPGTVNLYIQDNNIAAVATVFNFLKVNLLLTDKSIYAMLPLLRLFAQEPVTDLFTQLSLKDTDSVDKIIGSDNVSGVTIGSFRANPIAGIKTLFNANMAAPIVTPNVTINGVTGKTFTSEAYYDKLTPPTDILFTCYFDGNNLAYVTYNAAVSGGASADLLTFQVSITNTIANANVFKVPSLANFYFDITAFASVTALINLFK